MLDSAPILISHSAFGAAEVRRHGQAWFTQLAADAGADGVEVRGELLLDAGAELDAIAAVARDAGLAVVYSSPEGLWTDGGSLDLPALDRGLAAAARLGAPRLKMAIGGYAPRSADTLRELQTRLAAAPTELLIENDQTETAGTLAAMQRFFAAASAQGLKLGMTFDIGNWHWQGECPQQAAGALAPQVCYVHCKGVQRQPKKWVAVPLEESSAPWRAVLRALPPGLPWAIEYPLAGDDLLAVTKTQLTRLRAIARSPI